jgi:flagellar motor switch protein FliN/FliY
MHLKDILKLTKGSIIELDRLSGEAVDLFVNNKLIARGEVVVIDDNFGLRITQLAGNNVSASDLGLVGVDHE